MTKRMLIDATHAEETRVVVLEGNRLEDFDVETQSRKQLKGNIYLAKVVRVEPSLQAAFVEYGGNRHGFLAFSEIHPDYYQIPVADRQRLLQMQEDDARAEEEEEDRHAEGAASADVATPGAEPPEGSPVQPLAIDEPTLYDEIAVDALPVSPEHLTDTATFREPVTEPEQAPQDLVEVVSEAIPDAGHSAATPVPPPLVADLGADSAPEAAEPAVADNAMAHASARAGEADRAEDADAAAEVHADTGEDEGFGSRVQEVPAADVPPPETIGGESDNGEEARERRSPPRFLRNYKIQEVIRRRQIMLVQVVKEERGTKGAALTTYISLAGRYCVLMPNSPRGGGISRKITSAADRRRLKEVTAEMDIPRGMSLIVRTAGANRPKPEIKRDCEYLLRLWDDIRDHTLKSVAPALIYEEANLIKRAIRDVYSRDVDEVIVDGDDGWKAARDFMRMLMPTHVKKVQLWQDHGAPLFARQQVEAQLDAMLSPTVQLRSGGYLVINQTEALVAIDVNSGRSTRERGIEETAVRTNVEAAEEVARQLRLRDLAGLIVIDFIDMESKKNIGAVERRLKEALKTDRARIQVGHISHFGLMEMSRQRLRPSLAETSLTACPHCGGTGHVRSTDSAALHVLRAIEEEGGKRRAAEIMVHVPSSVALYVLNHKRQRLTDIEARFGMKVGFAADDSLLPSQPRIDRLRAQTAPELPAPLPTPQRAAEALPQDIDESDSEAEEFDAEGDDNADPDGAPVAGETAEEGERRRRRRRRRRRGGGAPRREDGTAVPGAHTPMPPDMEQPEIGENAFPVIAVPPVPPAPLPQAQEPADVAPAAEEPVLAEPVEAGDRPRRTRARRRKRPEGAAEEAVVGPYAGPTPANPFGGAGIDIFDLLDQVEPARPAPPAVPQAALPAQAAPTDLTVEQPPAKPVNEPAPASAEPDRHQASAETGPEPHAAEPVVGPAVQPVVIGGETETAVKKRGWWSR